MILLGANNSITITYKDRLPMDKNNPYVMFNLEAFNKYRSIDNLRSDFKHFIFANMMQSIISFGISRTSSENN